MMTDQVGNHDAVVKNKGIGIQRYNLLAWSFYVVTLHSNRNDSWNPDHIRYSEEGASQKRYYLLQNFET